MKRVAAALLLRWESVLVLLIIAVGLWCRSLSPLFLTKLNLLDLATPYIFVGLMALGLTFVVIAAEIDISVASILAVSVVVIGQIYETGTSIWFAATVGLLVATALGLFNGFLVAALALPSLAVTLGTLAAYRGLAFLIHSGEGVAPLVFVGTAIGLGFLLHATRFGRYIYAVGSSREAARYSGIPVTSVRMAV